MSKKNAKLTYTYEVPKFLRQYQAHLTLGSTTGMRPSTDEEAFGTIPSAPPPCPSGPPEAEEIDESKLSRDELLALLQADGATIVAEDETKTGKARRKKVSETTEGSWEDLLQDLGKKGGEEFESGKKRPASGDPATADAISGSEEVLQWKSKRQKTDQTASTSVSASKEADSKTNTKPTASRIVVQKKTTQKKTAQPSSLSFDLDE